MLRYALIYVLLLGALFALETTPGGQEFTTSSWTEFLARGSAFLMQRIDPRVVAEGSLIKNMETGYSVAILAGCNGVEASIILAAAIIPFPCSVGSKLLGIVGGVAAIQAANLLRIVTLFYLGEWSDSAFMVAHLYIWPALIILDALIIFLLWMRWQASRIRTA